MLTFPEDSDIVVIVNINLYYLIASNTTSDESPKNLQGEMKIFKAFIDIEENNKSNAELIHYILNSDNIEDEVLNILLPYSTPFSKAYSENILLQPRAAQIFNKQKGIDYAKKHATNPNKIPYGYKSQDCTNFVSQIMVAGDIQMHDKYPDEYSGWWFRTVPAAIPYPAYSVSWLRANNFVNFMGTSGNIYSHFPTFSEHVQAGDFISFDEYRDGSWDHLGFVTGIGTYNTYYVHGKDSYLYYRDFVIAQHTNDYNAWVSSSTCGWDTLAYDINCNYAIVRRNAVA